MLTESADCIRRDAAQQPTRKTPNGQRFGVRAFLSAQSWNSRGPSGGRGGASREFNVIKSSTKTIFSMQQEVNGGEARTFQPGFIHIAEAGAYAGTQSIIFIKLEEINE